VRPGLEGDGVQRLQVLNPDQLVLEQGERVGRVARERGGGALSSSEKRSGYGGCNTAPAARLSLSEMQTSATADHTDEQLLELVTLGHEGALAELYDRYGRATYGLALRVLRDRHLAEDAVQDAFLDVWRTAGRIGAGHDVRARIMVVVHRRAVDIVRREERRRELPAEPVPACPGSDELAEQRHAARRVRSALGRLPGCQRRLLELAYYGGFTQRELAEQFGVPLGTVKSRMFAGLARLRELLKDETPVALSRPDMTAAGTSARSAGESLSV
jgi:RNA polymerase sigma-70 factor, ECF subfamily